MYLSVVYSIVLTLHFYPCVTVPLILSLHMLEYLTVAGT